MKKHLLLILALLAFVLPARAATELLFNFTQDSNGTDRGTSFSNNANVTAVISNVSYGDTYNVTDYVSSLTGVSNAYYNSKGGLHLGPNGTVTVNLKNTYKVVKYEVMGPTPTQHSIVNTSATVTVNGHTYTGVNAAGSGNWNRVQYEPTATENVSSFTIKAGNTDVYVKSIHIYLEAESDFTAPKFVPNGGRVKKGQTITVVNCEPSRLPQMDVTYGSNNVANHTGDFTFTFDETGTFDCWATAHSSTWSDYSETTEVSFEVYEDTPTPATLSVNLKTGSYKLPQTVTVTSSKTDDDIIVILTDENDQEVVNDTFKGSWNRTFTTPGTFSLEALNGDGATINEIYEFGYAPEAPVFSKANGEYANGTEVTISSKYATKLAVKIIKKADYDANGFKATGTQTIYDAESHTLTLTEDVVIVAQGKNDFGTTSTDYRIYTIKTPEPCPIEITPASGNVTTGTDVVVSTVSGASLQITITKDGVTDINGEYVASPFRMTLTQPGTYTFTAVASATGYITSEKSATYTVTAPVREEVAPKITFEREDQYNFGDVEEIDVELKLNSDVYPVPDVIYYTLDGFMAHNTLETGNPGATPAGHVKPATVDPATLSAKVTIERSHRDVLNHRAVTINAYAFNTAGNDVAAATYIFNDNAAPLPDPEPTTITATVTMANQGWTSGQSPYTADNSFTATWTSDKIVDLDNATISFATVATSEGSSYPAFNSKNNPKGLRFYSTSTNDNTITVNVPDDSYRFVSVTFTGTNSLKVQGTTYTSGTKVDLTDKPSSIVLQSAVTSTMAVSKIEFVLEKTAAKAAVAPVNTKTATNVNTTVTFSTLWSSTGTKYTDGKTTDWTSDDKSFTFVTSNTGGSTKPGYFTGSPAGLRLYNGNKITVNAPNGYSFVSVKPTSSDPFKYDGVEKASGSTITFNSGTTSFTIEPKTAKKAISKLEFVLAPLGGSEDPTVEAPVISLSERANTTEPVTVTIDCATADAAVKYTVKKDGTTVADNLTYDAANKPVYSAVGSYTVDATATLGTASANATQATFEITEPEKPTVATPEITLSTQAKPSDPVTVTIDCATDGATINYTVTKDGTTVADNLTYDPASKPVFSEVGSYTVNATASKEGMNPANAAPANFTIEKLVEVVEELFFVMDQNLWDVDGAYPETVVPFVYDRENGWYDLDIASIPATGWRQTAEGWFEINGGFRGNFYVRDGKANRKGLVFGAAGTVANTTYATRAAADGNQLVEPGVEYNMYIAGEGDTHKVFTTIGDDTNSKAFSAGTIRVTHTPGNKDAAKPMTLQILANSDQTTGVDSITAEDAANDADARFFNLQGVEVPADRLAPGIYIRQAGSKATKVLVK